MRCPCLRISTPDTWQIDPAKIEAKITPNTAAILPVHILGGVCDMDRINAIAKKHDLKVIEDACEAHGGEWKGGKVGNLGDLGCFSFQTGKSLTCGEGGAILGHDEELMDRCYSFHNFGRGRGSVKPKRGQHYAMVGTKCRMAEYQAAILISQMERFEAECKRRSENAAYLTEKLTQIPGVVPRQDYPDVTRKAFYYYGLSYRKEQFDGLSRGQFVAALGKEGIPAQYQPGGPQRHAHEPRGMSRRRLPVQGLPDGLSTGEARQLPGRERVLRLRSAHRGRPSASTRACCLAPGKTWTTSPTRWVRSTSTGANLPRLSNCGRTAGAAATRLCRSGMRWSRAGGTQPRPRPGDPQRTKLVLDAQATKANLEKLIVRWLPSASQVLEQRAK